jgi:hypothetical protein
MVGRLVGPHPLLTVFSVASVAFVGCGDLKNAGPGGGGTSVGPGDKGGLPSGYCCTADAECRDRHCVAVGSGGRMCLDACIEQNTCVRRDLTFTCSGMKPGPSGFCQPPDAAFKCLPQTQYQRGVRQVGECCAHTGDGNAGEECDGNKCVAVDEGDNQNNPFVCSQWCELTKDCPSGTICELHACYPANRPYTCK